MNVTEIRGPKKLLFGPLDLVVYGLGNRAGRLPRLVRLLYWWVFRRYFWGIVNFVKDLNRPWYSR